VDILMSGLLKQLADRGLVLCKGQNGDLSIRGPLDRLSDDLKAELRIQRDALVKMVTETWPVEMGGQEYRYSLWYGQELDSPISIDSETELIESHEVPDLVLASVSDGERHFIVEPSRLDEFIRLHRNHHFVCHNAKFDFEVIEKALREAAPKKPPSFSSGNGPGQSSKKMDWETPQHLFDEWNAKFNFTLDACASSENAKCRHFFTADDDALVQDWGSNVVWMNPPYGSQLSKFIAKAHQASIDGATVVCLIPSRTDTRYWHDYVMQHEIISLKGRITFVGAKYSAPFPSAVVIMRPGSGK
jgi:phage N-6-adenine-methyltransferase